MPFSTVIGHAPIVSLLREAIARDRVPQSLLFGGPSGVGKRAMAVALAQALNCRQRVDGDACGRCPVCTRIARGLFSDVVVLDRGGDASIKIKALRERVLDVVGYRPFEGARRVFIIDEADELTIEAQDALLKTLEEPPPAVVIILVSAYPDTLRATVRSRCRRLQFGPLSEPDVARLLTERCGIDAAQARVLATASGGSVSQALAAEEGHLTEDREAALAVLHAATRPAPAPRLKAAADLQKHGSKRRDREALSARLAAMASLLRDLAVVDVSGLQRVVNSDLEEDLRRLSPAYRAERAAAAFAVVAKAQQDLDYNASPKIVADWVAVSI